jgi:hypothetical protein
MDKKGPNMNLSTLSEADQARIRTWQKWMLTLAFICEMFLAADWYAFAAVIPFISQTLNLNPAEAGLAQGIFAVTSVSAWWPGRRSVATCRRATCF